MKTAIIHDWLTGMRGGEKCLEIFCEMFPHADLYTLLHKPGSCSKRIENMSIKTSFLQHAPLIQTHYRHYLPLMPMAIESLNLSNYDFVLSTSHCVAKSVKTKPDTCHICYIHTPVRYAWDMYDHYFLSEKNPVKKALIWIVMKYIRNWDKKTAKRVNYYVANSQNIASKVKRFYNCEADVIYPPVDTNSRYTAKGDGSSYLIVSAFAPYKRLDIAIEAFNHLGYPLKIIGKGQNDAPLKALAKENITFLGWVSDKTIKKEYANCKALIFPGEEDFGIVPVEVQSAGRPVIAFGKGGILETVIPLDKTNKNCTGVFFNEQTPESLIDAIKRFESHKNMFESKNIRGNALRFSDSVFREKVSAFIEEKQRLFQKSI